MIIRRNKALVTLVLVLIVLLSASAVVSAFTSNRQVSGSGYKNYLNSSVRTGWSGLLSSTQYVFQNDQLTFTGNSYSKWLGASPYNADNVTHYDVLEVNGIGSVSFSGGVGANASGPTVNFGISGSTGSNSRTYAYTVSNNWKVNVNYSYYAEIAQMSWMDLFTAACFQFGSNFVVVNSRVDNPVVNRGTIYYT